MEGILIIDTADLVDELKTYESYFGFYPGGIKGMIQDAFLGRSNKIRYWKKAGFDPKEGFDFLLTIDEEFDRTHADHSKDNAYSQQAWESYDVVDIVSRDLVKRVSEMMALAAGRCEVFFLDRSKGYRWMGKSLVVYFGLYP